MLSIKIVTIRKIKQIINSVGPGFIVASAALGPGSIIHEVLRRQGLMEGIWTLNENETLSPGQKEEIDRIYVSYPHLNDDAFVKRNLGKWLG